VNFPIIENSYQFECTKCGNCCTGDQRVSLNPYDLYKIALFKGYADTGMLFDYKLVHLVQSQNKAWIPQIRFKSIAKGHRFCPFLINELDEQNKLLGLCSLHPDKKPLICAMAPVGRVVDFASGTENFIYVKPAPDCPGVDIQKDNKLSDLQKAMEMELYYEKEFLKILNAIVAKNPPKKYYLDNLYCFPVSSDIKEVLKRALIQS
jgi:Fe-S-cluster containining protein